MRASDFSEEDDELESFLDNLLEYAPQKSEDISHPNINSISFSIFDKIGDDDDDDDDNSDLLRYSDVNFDSTPVPANFLGIYSQYKNVTLNAPVHYPNLLAIALNSHDPTSVADFLHHTCTPNVRIFRMEYSHQRYLQTRQSPPLVEFSQADYLRYYEGLVNISPDSTSLVHSHRVCYEEACSIYICMGKYDGTLLLPGSDGTIVPKTFAAVGSVVLFRNKAGKIFRIEFYIDYSK